MPAQPISALPVLPDSPFRSPHLRRKSPSSPINMTPMRMSPQRKSATPSTPRSGSPRSFQLSDIESNTEETSSQAVQSSSGDEEPERMPQLVMPSLTMPARRAFTEAGKHIGRAKFMVVGHRRGIGSTSLIQNILRCSEHVVHVDHIAEQSSFNTKDSDLLSTSDGTDRLDHQTQTDEPAPYHFAEVLASTRMVPSWRSSNPHSEHRRTFRKKSSVSEGSLDRNLTFIEAPALNSDDAIKAVLDHVLACLQRSAHLESMTDSEIISMMSGDGSCHVTAVIYLFDPVLSECPLSGLSVAHQDFLRRISTYTNLVPVIGQADTISADALQHRKEQVSQLLEQVEVRPYTLLGHSSASVREPLAISSLPGDDNETIDASILMSSQYLAPLVASELDQLVENLVEPEALARMRYESSLRFLAWRQESLRDCIEHQRTNHLISPQLGYQTTDLASDGSFPENSSKSPMPHPSSSFSRSGSPAIPDSMTPLEAAAMGTSALARYNQQTQPTEPYRQVRLAKWAKDLQNSLQNQSRKYQKIYSLPISDWALSDDGHDHALVATKGGRRPARGHLGGEVGVIDPRDPLGMLAFAQTFRLRGFWLVQIVGGCGIVGAVFYCVAKTWPDLLEFVGLSSPADMVVTTAVPPPVSGDQGTLMRWLADVQLPGWSK